MMLFQFHKGTIKPKTQTRRLVNSHEFQFHKGTIKPENTTMTKLWHICFNSIKVRLNLSKGETTATLTPVSIP